jgi:hypothetical protein
MVLRFVLKHIGTYNAGDKLLNLVMKLQGKLGGDDTGFDSNLMELQTIIEWKQGAQFTAVELKLDNNTWKPAKEATTFLGWGKPTLWAYSDLTGRLAGTTGQSRPARAGCWHLVELPTCFCVFDVVLVFVPEGNGGNIQVFGAQLTVSKMPFAAHGTHETCQQPSMARINRLLKALQGKFNTEQEFVYTHAQEK